MSRYLPRGPCEERDCSVSRPPHNDVFWSGIAIMFGAIAVPVGLVVILTDPWRLAMWVAPGLILTGWSGLRGTGGEQ